MNEEQMPGARSSDQDVTRRWREASVEEPSSLVDARIRQAARQTLASDHLQRRARRSSRWGRYVPLAAAASVALLAVGLVRLVPREEYQALPGRNVTRNVTHSDEVRQAAPPPPEPALPAERGQLAGPAIEPPRTQSFGVVPPSIQVDRTQRAAELNSRQERAVPAPSPAEGSHRADDVIEEAPSAGSAEENLSSRRMVSPDEPLATAPRAKASAPRAPDSSPTTAITTSGHRSLLAAPESAIPEALAAEIRSDAARRTGTDPESTRIRSIEPTVWPDASLGCAPGIERADEPRVPGYVVTVDAPGTTLRYHTDDGDRIVVCNGE